MKRFRLPAFVFSITLTFAAVMPAILHGWGDEGHRYVSRVAVEKLPADMPAFFAKAVERIVFLGPEPDRWRDNRQLFSALREAGGPDHFIDMDMAGPRAFAVIPNDRYRFTDWVREMGLVPKEVGFLPYAALETHEKVQVMFRLWRETQDPAEKEQVEQNIVYYAGVLGHYIADGAQPLHTTIHYNGWSGSANPENFSRDPLHSRFESEYVRAQIKREDFSSLVATAKRLNDPFAEIMNHLFSSLDKVPELYRLEKTARWDKSNRNPASKKFVAERLAAAAQLLSNLWYTAWVDSAVTAERR